MLGGNYYRFKDKLKMKLISLNPAAGYLLMIRQGS
jgi:hypothetical protein